MINIKDIKHLPKKLGDAPDIQFGMDFEELKEYQKIIYLKKLASALNYSADLIQKERNKLLEEKEELKNLMANADNAVNIQKNIVLKAITEHNEYKQIVAKQLKELETRVKAQDKVIERLNNGNNG